MCLLILMHLLTMVMQQLNVKFCALQDVKIAADNDFETVLHSDVLSQIPDSLLNLTAITSLSLSSKGQLAHVPVLRSEQHINIFVPFSGSHIYSCSCKDFRCCKAPA